MCIDQITPAMWERQVTADLNIRGFSRKWRKAKEITDREVGNPESYRYWQLARTRFLELGGEFLSQRCGGL